MRRYVEFVYNGKPHLYNKVHDEIFIGCLYDDEIGLILDETEQLTIKKYYISLKREEKLERICN